jgi:hypothetical protein
MSAGTGVKSQNGSGPSWNEQSATRNVTTTTNLPLRPAVVPTDIDGLTLRFSGQSLPFLMPINGLSAMTVFLVACTTWDLDNGWWGINTAVCWLETASSGTTLVKSLPIRGNRAIWNDSSQQRGKIR